MIFCSARFSSLNMASLRWILVSILVWLSLGGHSLAETNATQRLKTVSQAKGIRNVYLQTTNGWKNLTKFKNPHNIYDSAISPDGQWAYVFHMDFKPVRLAIYNLAKQEKVAEISPGVGGNLSWSKSNRIIMEYGAGVGVNLVTIYDLNAKIIYQTYGNSQISEVCLIAVSPSKDFIVLMAEYENFANRIEIIRVADGAIWYYGNEKLAAADFTWTAPDKITVNRLTATPRVTSPLDIDVRAYTESHPPDRKFVPIK